MRLTWRRENHTLSLEVSDNVQDGVQLQTEHLNLFALFLSHTFPSFHLSWLWAGLQHLPRATDPLQERGWTKMSYFYICNFWLDVYSWPTVRVHVKLDISLLVSLWGIFPNYWLLFKFICQVIVVMHYHFWPIFKFNFFAIFGVTAIKLLYDSAIKIFKKPFE